MSMSEKLYCKFMTLFFLHFVLQASGLSLLGCPADESVRAASQSRMKELLVQLLDVELTPTAPLLWKLIEEHTGTTSIVHDASQAEGYATSHRPLPCVPGIVAVEFLQLLWLRREDAEWSAAFVRSAQHLSVLRVSSWATVLSLGYGVLYAVGQALCEALPTSLEVESLHLHMAWPGSTTNEATVLKQFHVLSGFDYRRCAQQLPRLLKHQDEQKRDQRLRDEEVECFAFRTHRRFADLAARQPWACGRLCHQAAAFARLAEALLHRTNNASANNANGLSHDDVWLIDTAQAEILFLEPQDVELSCALARAFPIFTLLSMLVGIDASNKSESEPNAPNAKVALKAPHQPPPPTLAKLCDVSEPLRQRLTAEGALTLYFLVQSLGKLLDHFQVTWWLSSGALLGALRNGGLLLQDCDVDIALWRPHISPLASPAFKAALAAAGIAMYHMPIYFQFRFCMINVPAAGDVRAVHGLACHLPYVDAHLADHAEPGRWNYIHRTELRYAQSFPLTGIFDAGDARHRGTLGEAEVWLPRLREAEQYLSQLYGSDWRSALRDRHGRFLRNASGGHAEPTGPLRDVLREQTMLGNLLPEAAVTCSHACDL